MHYNLSIKFNPSFSDAYLNLAIVFRNLNRGDDMLNYIKQGLAVKKCPKMLNLLGCYYHEKNKYTEAINYFMEGLGISDILPEDKKMILINLSSALIHDKKNNSARNCLIEAEKIHYESKIVEKEQQINETYNINMGMLELSDYNYEKSEEYYLKALPTCRDLKNKISIYDNLGHSYLAYGEIKKAMDCYDKIIEMPNIDKNKMIEVFQNKIYSMNFLEIPADKIFQEHLKLNDFYKDVKQLCNKKYKHTKLKIGFVSPDFNGHPVMMFVKKLFELYDKNKFVLYCFSNTQKTDNFTPEIKQLVDFWYDIVSETNDETVAKIIKKEEIDILI